MSEGAEVFEVAQISGFSNTVLGRRDAANSVVCHIGAHQTQNTIARK